HAPGSDPGSIVRAQTPRSQGPRWRRRTGIVATGPDAARERRERDQKAATGRFRRPARTRAEGAAPTLACRGDRVARVEGPVPIRQYRSIPAPSRERIRPLRRFAATGSHRRKPWEESTSGNRLARPGRGAPPTREDLRGIREPAHSDSNLESPGAAESTDQRSGQRRADPYRESAEARDRGPASGQQRAAGPRQKAPRRPHRGPRSPDARPERKRRERSRAVSCRALVSAFP